MRPLILVLVIITFIIGCSRPKSDRQFGSVQVAPGVSFALEDGEEYHRRAPDTFEIPPLEMREELEPNQIVKLMFNISANGESQVERMWVIVRSKDADGYVGELDNQPVTTDKMRPGLKVRFQPRHVISIYHKKASE
jgi:Uncharacterized protein conserved in bacteria (DUF2314)